MDGVAELGRAWLSGWIQAQTRSSAASNSGAGSGAGSAVGAASDGSLSRAVAAFGFTAAEAARIQAATGAQVGPEGMIDFTTGRAAGRHTGRIPEGGTVCGVTFTGIGSVAWFGAVDPGEEAQVPSQRANLPRGTLVGMQIQFAPGATSSQRSMLLNDVALSYVNDLDTGANKTKWSPHAIFPMKSMAEAAALRSSTPPSRVLDRSL